MWTPFGQIPDKPPKPIEVHEHDPWKSTDKAIANRQKRSKVHHLLGPENIAQPVLTNQEIETVKHQRAGSIVVQEVTTSEELLEE